MMMVNRLLERDIKLGWHMPERALWVDLISSDIYLELLPSFLSFFLLYVCGKRFVYPSSSTNPCTSCYLRYTPWKDKSVTPNKKVAIASSSDEGTVLEPSRGMGPPGSSVLKATGQLCPQGGCGNVLL